MPSPLVWLWTLRMLVLLGGGETLAEQLDRDDRDAHRMAHLLGLKDYWRFAPEHENDEDYKELDRDAVLAQLQETLHAAEQTSRHPDTPDALQKNVTQLAELASLDPLECQILEFAVQLNLSPVLNRADRYQEEAGNPDFRRKLALVLNAPETKIRAAFKHGGALMRSGLLKLDPRREDDCSFKDRIDFLNGDFALRLAEPELAPLDLLREWVRPAPAPELALDDYAHLPAVAKILAPYLKAATASGKAGANILLYGLPGTGKTQLARVLAQALGQKLFEVSCEDEDGDSVSGSRRLQAYRMAQCFLRQEGGLLCFDEAEDAFGSAPSGFFLFFGPRPEKQAGKAWMNRMLEENPMPTLWLSNSTGGIDPAAMRRFDIVLEVPVPPKKQREKILQMACGDVLDARAIARIAESEKLAPAIATRAATVAKAIGGESPEETAQILETLVNNTLEAQRHAPIKKHDPNRLPEIYDPRFVKADADLSAIARGLAKTHSGRLCLYGPPGTGKTAYGHWLAEQLEMPILVKRCSDLISCWVGQTEKNIARAFKDAEREGALLLIDEVDSFLQDRRRAQRSWATTEVNDMLTQMENFAGVFIASTNLIDGLDQASLRRFDLKVKFDFLHPEQAWNLLCRHCESLGMPEPDEEAWSALRKLENLV
ncbi:MAG: AAA family ATPase, partial [Zoogloeaceae bacterium]|nr:AAA family ATPase [Zoogloeaceae bacterium]